MAAGPLPKLQKPALPRAPAPPKILGGSATRGGKSPGPADMARLRKTAIKRGRGGVPAKHSVLIRQKHLGGGLPSAKKLGSVKSLAKGGAGKAKGGLGKELAHLKKPAAQIKKPALKNAAALKKAAVANRKAALKGMAPAKSALIRQKGHVDKSLLSEAKKAGKLKSLSKGGLGKAKGELGKAKGGVGKELAYLKKPAAKIKKPALKNAAALKKALAANRKAALKHLAPAHSALVRQKKLAGHGLSGAKGGLGKELAKAKSLAKGGVGKDLGKAKGLTKGVGKDMGQISKAGKSALSSKKVGALARSAKSPAKGAAKFFRR